MTTCEYDGTEATYNCARYEQCDECYLKDNPLKLKVVSDTGTREFEAVLTTQ